MNLILSTLVRSVPSMVYIVILLGIILYMYAVVRHTLFHEHDLARWGNLGLSILSLFQVITLDDWSVILHTAMELEPLAWVYFVSFVVTATFVGLNLFVAIVVENMDEINKERLRRREHPPTRDSLLSELRATHQSLQRLEEQLQRQLPRNDC